MEVIEISNNDEYFNYDVKLTHDEFLSIDVLFDKQDKYEEFDDFLQDYFLHKAKKKLLFLTTFFD